MTAKQLNRLMLVSLAPFIGMMIWLLGTNLSFELTDSAFPKDTAMRASIPEGTNTVISGLDQAKAMALHTASSIKKSVKQYHAMNENLNVVVVLTRSQLGRPALIYDRRITRKIGSPVQQVQSDKLTAQLFTINAQYFSGYAMKVKLKSSKGMKMVLGNDKYGSAETTLSAVRRYNAIAGVNAGGFADQAGKRYPLSTTVLNGQYLGGFQPSEKDLFFVGINESLKLVGGKVTDQSDLDAKKLKFGASFVPVLMKNGVPMPIPAKWQTSPSRAPRTVIANYKDNQLLFLVIDGRNEAGSSGATLEEMQYLLARFGAIDGYNLDGGGSSSLIFNGRIINHPADGTLRPLPTHFLFFK
ncbi:phosphodiester glycosidase family protein [Paenibacillus sp. OV219]|uniref:phosphodiester glycosidase family protein n=1 Tax=Paenibacillus sp. OV219 TaxID=1884377 RepID=UPI0008C54CFD|nr:phosphodiester glycosidase family protein [Paenibacillus sp. OV219]SEO16594.1 Predicted protein [Paenibacillus sp. OV219]